MSPNVHVVIGGVSIEVGVSGLRYFGLELEGRWSLRAHSEKLGPRPKETAGSLSQLPPKVGGRNQVVCRLYIGCCGQWHFTALPFGVETDPRERSRAATSLTRDRGLGDSRIPHGLLRGSVSAAVYRW